MKRFVFVLCPLLIWMHFSSCSGTRQSGEAEWDSRPEEPKIVLDLSPSEGNPRNSEGDFISLKDGRTMFVYSRYTGDSTEDDAPAELAARYSDDGGETWTGKDEIIVPNEGGLNVMSVSLLRLQSGEIALFYLRKNSGKDCIPLLRLSDDEGKSWSEPIECITDKKGYFVLNNDRIIQLEDGRLVMAVSLHESPETGWHEKGDLFGYYSDDNGRTWISSDQVPDTTNIITQEPGLIEMKDGQIMMYIRATGGFQQLSFSPDRGETWSHIETSTIPSPLSPATIERIPSTDDWLMIWNNNDGSNPEMKKKRTPVTVAVSHDEGRSWNYIKNIEDNPGGWYCYTALYFQDENSVLLGYCAGIRPEQHGLSVTHLTKLDLDWIYQEVE